MACILTNFWDFVTFCSIFVLVMGAHLHIYSGFSICLSVYLSVCLWQAVFDDADYKSSIIWNLNSTDRSILIDHWAFINFVMSYQIELRIGRQRFSNTKSYQKLSISWSILIENYRNCQLARDRPSKCGDINYWDTRVCIRKSDFGSNSLRTFT